MQVRPHKKLAGVDPERHRKLVDPFQSAPRWEKSDQTREWPKMETSSSDLRRTHARQSRLGRTRLQCRPRTHDGTGRPCGTPWSGALLVLTDVGYSESEKLQETEPSHVCDHCRCSQVRRYCSTRSLYAGLHHRTTPVGYGSAGRRYGAKLERKMRQGVQQETR